MWRVGPTVRPFNTVSACGGCETVVYEVNGWTENSTRDVEVEGVEGGRVRPTIRPFNTVGVVEVGGWFTK